MKILAIEFSSVQRSVAVAVAGQRDGPSLPAPRAARIYEVVETGGQASKVFAMIEEALRQAQLEREQVEGLVVGLGPGSYTGIRAAIALAQGWALAANVRLLGISSADCIAAGAAADGVVGRFAVVIDAQRGEFYWAAYEAGQGACKQVEPLRITSRDHITTRADAGDLIVGPEVTKWFPSGRLVLPRAAILCQLAEGRSDFVPGETLEPIYLRETTFVKAPPPRTYS